MSLEELDQVEELAACHRCGCTDLDGCAGGCFWVELIETLDAPALCSACATEGELHAFYRQLGAFDVDQVEQR